MAQHKAGLEYFPLDTNMDQDDNIQMIEAKYPEKGFEIIIKLLMKIYKESYYYQWGEKEQLLFTNRIQNVDINYLNAVINDAIEWGLFNKKVYKKYGILTSNGIQKRYFEAIKRRKKVEIIEEYIVNVNNLPENVDIIRKNVNIPGQSKESKESKERERTKYGSYNNVLLTNDEYERLKKDLNGDVDKIINNYSEIKEMKGYKYKSDNLAIRRWGIKAFYKNNPKKPKDPTDLGDVTGRI